LAGKFAFKLRNLLFKEHLGLAGKQDHSTLTKSCLPPFKTKVVYELLHEKDSSISKMFDEPLSSGHSKQPTGEDSILIDPLSDEFYNYWSSRANENTEIYRKIFHCIPDDQGETYNSVHT